MENKTNKKFTEKQVAERFEEAVRTLERLPAVRVSGYAACWPEIVYSKAEIAMMDCKPMRCLATANQISEMEETCGWIKFLREPDDRRLIWLRASKTPWQEICKELGFSRAKAHYKWKNDIRRITRNISKGSIG